MDIYTALERLENVRKLLAIQASETKKFWDDGMRYKFYSNVVDCYDPDTINFVSQFKETNEKFESWLYELRKMDNEY